MKKTLILLLIAVPALLVHAQGTTLQNQEEEDSTIAVIAYFCKNDTMTYRRVQGKEKIIGNDTTSMSELTENFMIVVTDSTSKGYKMELIPVSYEMKGGANNWESRMASLLWKDMKNMRCRFTTDEFGTVQHIENWREIRDLLKKSYVTVFDSLYAEIPGLDSMMPRKQLESLILLGCSTEDGIKEMYDELEQLFGMHGNEWSLKPVESDDVSDAGYPTHTILESFYSAQKDEYDIEGDYVIHGRTDTALSPEDAKDLLSTTVGALFSGEVGDSISKYSNMALDDNKGMTITNHEQYCYFYNGWPKLMQTVKEIKVGDLFKRIEYDTIEWTTRHWGVFTFPEKEEEGKSF